MSRKTLATLGAVIAASAIVAACTMPGQSDEVRCGWIENPTPGNWFLTDRDGRWTIATQGGEQAQGFDMMPDMSAGEWVASDARGSYGHGCGCLTMRDDPAEMKVLALLKIRQKPLNDCRADPALLPSEPKYSGRG